MSARILAEKKKKDPLCIEFDDRCVVTSECCTEISHVECIDKVCQCGTDYTWDIEKRNCFSTGLSTLVIVVISVVCGVALICWIASAYVLRNEKDTPEEIPRPVYPPPEVIHESSPPQATPRSQPYQTTIENRNSRFNSSDREAQISRNSNHDSTEIQIPPSDNSPPYFFPASAPLEDLPPSYDEVQNAADLSSLPYGFILPPALDSNHSMQDNDQQCDLETTSNNES